MANWVLKTILGSKNQREVRRLRPTVARINELEQQYEKLSDEELQAKSAAWKAELAQVEDPDQLARRLNESLWENFV
jgi:preprotein translocase subunit SecA